MLYRKVFRLAVALLLLTASSLPLNSKEAVQQSRSDCPTYSLEVPELWCDLPAKFSLKFSDNTDDERLSYEWKVSKGIRIRDGQGTQAITVEIDPDAKPDDCSRFVSVEIGGLDSSCGNKASASLSDCPC